MLEQTTQPMFIENLHTKFREELPSGSLELELVSVTDHGSTPNHDQFSLLFVAPRDFPITQRVFALQHEVLGTFSLMLVPVGRDSRGIQFEAVINRLRQPAQ